MPIITELKEKRRVLKERNGANKYVCPKKLENVNKNRSAMRTWGLMLKFIPFGWNAVLTYQCLEAELLQAKR